MKRFLNFSLKAGPLCAFSSMEPPCAQNTRSFTASPPILPVAGLHTVSPPSSLPGTASCFIWRAMGAACGA
ncbi:hypothetical protein D9M70_624670 [compost metagenome]